VPSRACVLVDMTSQEALKLVISGGSYVPGAIGAALSTQAAIERSENTAPLTLP